MNERVKKLSDEARALPSEELAELVDELLSALHEADPEIEKAWAEQADRRLNAVRRVECETRDAAEVFADIRKRLGEAKVRRRL